jgi:hypothetical protein
MRNYLAYRSFISAFAEVFTDLKLPPGGLSYSNLSKTLWRATAGPRYYELRPLLARISIPERTAETMRNR